MKKKSVLHLPFPALGVLQTVALVAPWEVPHLWSPSVEAG